MIRSLSRKPRCEWLEEMSKHHIRRQERIEARYAHNSYEPRTANAIRDAFILQLFSTKSSILDEKTLAVYTVNKYQKLAQFILYRINLYKPAPEFLIDKSDLTPRLRFELERLRKSSSKIFEKIVTDSVQTILESVDKQYHHVSGIPYKVSWRVVPQR